jgi:hypothetical protein
MFRHLVVVVLVVLVWVRVVEEEAVGALLIGEAVLEVGVMKAEIPEMVVAAAVVTIEIEIKLHPPIHVGVSVT